MRKENVFLVTGRYPSGSPQGQGDGLVQRVLCAANEQALHQFIKASFPDLAVVGIVSLVGLEATLAQIKRALGGAGEIPVFVDPAMAD
jgi:hypothetical protein